jgi:hypothetical protein
MYTTRLIEAYLDGSLEKDLAEEITKRAAKDMEFAELIRLHREVNESIRDNELERLRYTIRKIASEENVLPILVKSPIRRIIQIAAVFLFLLIMGTVAIKWFYAGSSKSVVFEKYYEKYDPDIITRSETLAGNSLEKAQFLYQTGDYTPCVGILSDIVSNEKQNYMAWFYLGLVRMEIHQPTQAIKDFLNIPSDWKSPYLIHRDWYLALCFIKTGQQKEAVSLLQHLASVRGFYSERARKMLDEYQEMILR